MKKLLIATLILTIFTSSAPLKGEKNTKLIFCPFTDCESFAEFPPEIIEEIK